MIENILERLEELIHKSFNESLKGYPFASARNGAYQEAKKIVQEVAKDGGWIPCSERLPEEEKKVLVQYEGCGWDEEIISDYAIARYRKDYGDWSGTFCGEPMNVIAWRPLPAPYQKDTHSRCDTCTHNVADEVPPICYMCSKGIEDNYQKGE